MKGTIENEYNKPDQATMHPLLISLWKEFDDFCIIGKKVEVGLRLFDIFERNRVFIFLLESWGTH